MSWSGTDDDSSTALTNTVTMPSAHTASVTYGQVVPTATATPAADELPKTGEPVDAPLALIGLFLAVLGAVALHLARGRPTVP